MPVGRIKKVKQPENETFFEAVFQNSMDGILITTPDGDILAANPVACRILGRSEAEIIKQGRNGLIDLTDDRLPWLLEERKRTGRARGLIRMIRKDGSLFPVDIDSTVYRADDGKHRTVVIIRDITEEIIAEDLRVSTIEILSIFNNTNNKYDLIKTITDYLREKLKYEAVGIRLKDGADYPYFQSSGFPHRFILSENFLCDHSKEGAPGLDSNANPVFECMCGNVIQGRVDPTKPYFTSHGSFWTNSTTELLMTTSEADRQARTRNRCNGEGYESVGLFPMRTNNITFGLLQVNDSRKGMFSPAKISFFETLGDNLAIALDKYLTSEALSKSEALLRGIIDNSREGINLLDLTTGKYIIMSPSQVQLTGFTPEEIHNFTSEDVADRFHPEDRQILSGHLQRIINNETSPGTVEYRWKVKSGEYRWFSDSRNLISDRDGKAVALVGISRDITDSRQMRDQLIRNEQLLKEAQALVQLGNWDYDINTDKAKCSEEMFNIFGVIHTPGGLSWRDHKKLVFPEDLEKLGYDIRNAIEKAASFNTEFRIVMPDNSLKWINAIGNVKKDFEGEGNRLYGTVQDITARKNAELTLERAELLLRSVLSNAPVTIFATDNKGIFTLSEGRELVKAGLKSGENVGVSAYDLYGSLSFIENSGNKITGKVVLDRALSGDTMTLTNELNGVYFENHIAPITNEKYEVTGIVGLAINITDRKVLEMSLRKSEARYRMLFNHSTIPIWEADFSKVKEYLEKLKKREVRDFLPYFLENPEKTVYCISLVKLTDVNQTALHYFGVKNISDLTLRLPRLFTKKSIVIFAELLASLAEGRKQSERDIPLKTFDGKIKYLNLRLQVMSDSFFTLSRVIVTWIDISDRMNYEENLKKSREALRELNRHIEEARENERIRISLNLHDDLGQKLTAIKMDISWLKSRIGVQSPLVVNKLTGIIGMIDDTVETVQNISADLWPGMLYDLGLKTAVEWQLERFTRNTGIKGSFKISPSDFHVEDKLSIMLYRIIQESLTNVSRHSKAKNVWISMESGTDNLKLTVRDNGVGIEKEKLNDPKSFGLMSLRERARAYGGELKITGKKGVGTRVHVEIPLDVRI